MAGNTTTLVNLGDVRKRRYAKTVDTNMSGEYGSKVN